MGGERQRPKLEGRVMNAKKLMLLVAMLAMVVVMASVAAPAMAQDAKGAAKAAKAQAKAAKAATKMQQMPKTGGVPINASLLGLGSGALLVGGGLLASRIVRRT